MATARAMSSAAVNTTTSLMFKCPPLHSCPRVLALNFNRTLSKRLITFRAIYRLDQITVKKEGQPETLDYRVFFTPYHSFSSPLHHPTLTHKRSNYAPQQWLQQESQQDPYDLMKEDPIQVCSDLWLKSFSPPHNSKPFSNLTGFLSKFDLWILAYQRSVAHATGSFPSRNAIHPGALSSLLSLRNAVVKGQFRWGTKTHLFIHSPREKPLSRMSNRKIQKMLESPEPPFQDRVVQEVLLLILEPIFESRFSSKSHAFRPGRSAHTVIRTIRSNFAGYVWLLKGDVSDSLVNTDVDLVMSCLEKGVKDRTVLNIIRAALRTPMRDAFENDNDDDSGKKKKRKGSRKKILNENEPKPDPYWLRAFFDFNPEEAAKVPNYGHCGILSPLLANICLNELDKMMEHRIIEFFCPSKLDSIWRNSISDGCHNPAWPEFVPSSGNEKTKKMDYVRYAGHFLIGIRGPREAAVETRAAVIDFCRRELGIMLDNSKVEIQHISRGVQFLDHNICRRVIYPTLHYTGSGGKIVSQKGVGTLLSVSACLQQCIRQFRRLDLLKGDKDPEPLPCTPMLYSSQAHTNAQMNKFLETMADWYKYADNRKKVVGFCAYVIRSSLAKLYAARYRLKSRAKVYGIATRNLSHPLVESSNNSAPEYSDLLRMGLVDAIEGIQFSHMSLIPTCDYTPFPRNWIPSHEQILLEYIKLQNPKYFCQLHKAAKRHISSPQEEISDMVWDYKTVGVGRMGDDKRGSQEQK